MKARWDPPNASGSNRNFEYGWTGRIVAPASRALPSGLPYGQRSDHCWLMTDCIALLDWMHARARQQRAMARPPGSCGSRWSSRWLYIVLLVVAGLRAHSLALLSEAGHNLSDFFALLLSWGAVYLQARTPTRARPLATTAPACWPPSSTASSLVLISFYICTKPSTAC